MELYLLLFIPLFLKIKIIKSISAKEYLEDTSLYMNEICSNNGIPKMDKETNTIICECEEKYADEPRKDYKKYINNHFVQCSYEKKRRFLTFFLSAICPLGLDFFYLGHYGFFALILFIFLLTTSFYIFYFILNYKIQKKIEEEKRKKKIKKSKDKKITEINSTCVKTINIISNILIAFVVFYWIIISIIQALGFIKDSNDIPTENDMNYLFELPED